MSEHSGVQCPALFYPFPQISPPWQATPFERCHLHCLGSTTFSWGLGSRMSSALVASIFGKAKQETLPVHNAVPPPQPPGDRVIDNPDSHLRFRFHTALSSPLPSPLSRSLTTRILIYSHWQSYLHSDAIMRQDSLLRAEGAPGMWGGFGTLLEGWGALRPSRADLHTPVFQRKCPDWYSSHPPLLQACMNLLSLFIPDGEQCWCW